MVLPQTIRATALYALLLSPLTAPATAQTPLGGMITGVSIDRIVELASAYGPSERRFDDAEDGPWIRAEMGDVVYTISFMNCISDENCTSLQLRAWWESEGAHTLEQMNAWNRDFRFGTAYLDASNNATIEFDVNLTGGVTAVNFDDTLQWWQIVLGEFRATAIEPGFTAAGRGGGATLSKQASGSGRY